MSYSRWSTSDIARLTQAIPQVRAFLVAACCSAGRIKTGASSRSAIARDSSAWKRKASLGFSVRMCASAKIRKATNSGLGGGRFGGCGIIPATVELGSYRNPAEHGLPAPDSRPFETINNCDVVLPDDNDEWGRDGPNLGAAIPAAIGLAVMAAVVLTPLYYAISWLLSRLFGAP